MKKMIMYIIALCGATCLVGSQSDQKLAKYHELKENLAYKELVHVLGDSLGQYNCRFPNDLIDIVSGLLEVDGHVDTSNSCFKRGYAEINYGKDIREVVLGDKLFGTMFGSAQALGSEAVNSGLRCAEITFGKMAICSNTNNRHMLGTGVRCIQVLKRGAVAAGCHPSETTSNISLFDPISGQCLDTIPTVSAVDALCEPREGNLFSAHGDGKIRLWDLARKECLQTFPAHLQKILYLAQMPGGYLVAFGRKFRRRQADAEYWTVIWKTRKVLDIQESAALQSCESWISSTSALSSSSASSSASSSSSSHISRGRMGTRFIPALSNLPGMLTRSLKIPSDIDLSLVGGL